MSQFYQVFFEETEEHLAEMERLLVSLDLNAPEREDLNAIFRAAHSIKGGSGTFGFNDMTEVTHILETLLDRTRQGTSTLTPAMVDAFLEAKDALKCQLDGHRHGTEVDRTRVARVCVALQAFADVPAAGRLETVPEARVRYRVELSGIVGVQLEPLLAELRQRGELIVTGGNEVELALTLQTACSEEELSELCAFVLNPEQVRICREDEAQAVAPDTKQDEGFGFFEGAPGLPIAPEGDAGYGFFVATDSPVSKTGEEQGYGFFVEISSPIQQPAAQTPARPREGRGAGERSGAGPLRPGRRETDKYALAASGESSSIRVGVEKVDQLINLVGELVITQAMLAQTASHMDPLVHEKLLNGMAQLERNTRDLQESVMSIRMVPMDWVFSRFPRLVRDLAGKLGKEVELVTHGAATELDKGLIERIVDPLTHLVRNSLDHGIEMPDAREAAGKPRSGRLTLRAAHQGGSIVIEVSDDGAGLNPEKILARARERGLPVSSGMSDHEVWQLVFEPGFSTADAVTEVSGRGVGMDVVKRNIQAMGGRVELTSTRGVGTVTTLSLPLTLAILDGMSVAVGDETYILPLSCVVESLQPAPSDIKNISGYGAVVKVRSEYLPLVALHRFFSVEPRVSDPSQGIVVVLEAEGKKIALLVDELVGQQQVVVKNLESNYRKVVGVSGATILGDGSVSLILDVAALARASRQIRPESAFA